MPRFVEETPSRADPTAGVSAERAAHRGRRLDRSTKSRAGRALDRGPRRQARAARAYVGRARSALSRTHHSARRQAALDPRAEPRGRADRRAARSPSARPASLRGPLHGIPILVKDNIDTGDKMTHDRRLARARGTCARAARCVRDRQAARGRRDHPRQDQPLEWANFRGTSSLVGLERARRPCRNPYALDRIAVGLEQRLRGRDRRRACAPPRSAARRTARSSRRRAATGSSASSQRSASSAASGVIPISPSQDTLGPMARSSPTPRSAHRDRWLRSRGSRHRAHGAPRARGLHEVSRSQGARRRAARRATQGLVRHRARRRYDHDRRTRQAPEPRRGARRQRRARDSARRSAPPSSRCSSPR